MASTADLADLADRFEVSGPARILYRATAGHPSTTMIDWYAILHHAWDLKFKAWLYVCDQATSNSVFHYPFLPAGSCLGWIDSKCDFLWSFSKIL
jgi:hypothetical protein